MSAFITLGNAARYLAGDAGTPQEIAIFAVLLESEADSLRAVKTWTEHSSDLPGGVSYWRPLEQWRIPKVAFVAWCKANGYPVEQASNAITLVQSGTGRRAQQIDEMLRVVKEFKWDPLLIPYGGKQKVKARCLSLSLFTESAFDHAWKEAVSSNHLRMQGHELFSKR